MSLILSTLFFPFFTSLDTLTPDQFIKDGQSLVSNENNFALGFFSPGNSSYQYLGIWFVKVTKQTVVWVAKMNDPINDSSGVLSINQFGNLVLHDGFNRLLWSTNVSVQGTTSSVAQLQDSGNLVLIQGNNKKVLWQSFDHPTDTLLPNMRLGLNRIIGLDRFLTSWKSQDDPGSGDYLYKMNSTCGSPQVAMYKGSTLYWRSDPWPWQTSSPSSSTSVSIMGFKYDFVNNKDEVSYAYFFDDPSIISRVVVDNLDCTRYLCGMMVIFNGRNSIQHLNTGVTTMDTGAYGKCGPQSSDNVDNFECTCLPGYEAKSPKDWYHRDGSEGCVRKKSGLSMCGMDMSMSSSKCEQACLNNCSCTAFISMNIDGIGTRCLAWYGELMDIVEYSYEVWDLNVRVDAKELATYTKMSKGFLANKRKLVITILSVAVPLFLASLVAFTWLMKKRKKKGQLSNGQLIAVKRLCKNSRQGIEEFKNEVMLIAKLQHRNFVKLFGCCI
uniref:Uncharacterized protein n=1 Tax=Quercus lobata TaxID=97700 RepID=A0A7N2LUY9_QUELO